MATLRKFYNINRISITGFLIILGLYIQIPVKAVFSHPIYINASDLCMSFLPWIIGYTLFAQRKSLDNLQYVFPHVIKWGIGCSILLTISMLQGWYQCQYLSTWALFNKYIGWYILLGYAVLGYTLAVNSSEEQIKRYCYILWVFPVLLTGLHVILLLGITFCSWPIYLLKLTGFPEWRLRFSGLHINPNSMGFLLLCGYIILLNGSYKLKNLLAIFLVSMQFLGMLLTSSKIICLLAVCCSLYQLTINKKMRSQLVLGMAVGILLFIIIEYLLLGPISRASEVGGNAHIELIMDLFRQVAPTKMTSIAGRLPTYQKAWQLILQAPLWGIGLGRFLELPSNLGGQTVHNTFLWLWLEVGVLMLILIVLALVRILHYAFFQYKTAYRNHQSLQMALANALMVMVVAWGGMALVHEALYQRCIWFLGAYCVGALVDGRFAEPKEKEVNQVPLMHAV